VPAHAVPIRAAVELPVGERRRLRHAEYLALWALPRGGPLRAVEPGALAIGGMRRPRWQAVAYFPGEDAVLALRPATSNQTRESCIRYAARRVETMTRRHARGGSPTVER
jgi:hypothetical protein